MAFTAKLSTETQKLLNLAKSKIYYTEQDVKKITNDYVINKALKDFLKVEQEEVKENGSSRSSEQHNTEQSTEAANTNNTGKPSGMDTQENSSS